MRRPHLFISILWILSCGIAAPILAQTGGTGALNGTVTDSAKATVPDVSVTLTNSDSDETRTATTNSDGTYAFPLLPPGSYELRFEATGFKALIRPHIVVSVTEIVRVDA